jgi:cytochrome d ubiquinol oxidase subunit II
MIDIWFALVSFMLIGYVVLDGRNFGAGILHHIVAKTPEERRQVLLAVGPIYSWHEVWLVAFGGTLLAVFPKLLASAFAGYYLALFLILWCLILRGISLEMRDHIDDRMWHAFWDFVFPFSSTILAIVFGAAAGNLVRGVYIDKQGDFSMAFFTDFGVRGDVGILDWYTVSVAVFAALMLAAHGATYLTLKTEGLVRDRSQSLAKKLWLGILPLFAIVSAETLYVRPDFPGDMVKNPFAWIGIIVVLVSVFLIFSGFLEHNEYRAFLGSNFVIAGLLGTGASTLFPVMLYSTKDPAYSMTAYSSASSSGALTMAIIWWPITFILIVVYFVYLNRQYAGKVKSTNDDQH